MCVGGQEVCLDETGRTDPELIKSFGDLPLVVIASGMENVLAIFLVAVGLGLLSNISAFLLAPQWSYVSLLTVICLLLLLRPEGLSGTVPGRDY